MVGNRRESAHTAGDATTKLIDDLAKVLEAETDSLYELAQIGGLDPAKDFRGADLQGFDLSGQDLHDMDLSGADLRNANLRGAILSFANIRTASLAGADLSEAQVDGCTQEELDNLTSHGIGLGDQPQLPFPVPSGEAEFPLIFDVSAWWPEALSNPVLQTYRRMLPVPEYETIVRQLAEEMVRCGGNPVEGAWAVWFGAEKHILLMISATLESPLTALEATRALSRIYRCLSPADYINLIKRTAHALWEASGRQSGHALDHWLAAEKKVLVIVFAVMKTALWPGLIRDSETIVRTLTPAGYLELIERTARQIWEKTGRSGEHTLRNWVIAETVVLSSMATAVEHTSSAAEAGRRFFQAFEDTASADPEAAWTRPITALWDEAGRHTFDALDSLHSFQMGILNSMTGNARHLAAIH